MKKLLTFFIFVYATFAIAQIDEGFEGATFPPTGWAVFDNGIGIAQSWNETTNAALVYQGAKAAFLNRENVTDGTFALDWLVTSQVTVPPNGQLRFYTRKTQNGNFGSIYSVRVSTASQTTDTDFTTVQSWDETTLVTTYNVYEQKIVPLTAYAGQNVYIAFVMQNDNGDRWLVDNVKVDQQCLDNTNLTAAPQATTATLSWANPSGATQWEIEYGPAGFTQGTGTIVTATTNPFQLTGLTPLTGYSFYIRAICDTDNASGWSGPVDFNTSAAPPECGGNFVDPGGTANYANNTDYTVTICPTNPGDLVTVTFTSFDTEANWDALYVFNGNSIASPQIASANGAGNVPGGLAGGFWGTAIPGPFTSGSIDGCLTFRFRSDGSVTRAGWTANITCAPAPTCMSPTAVTFTSITSSSAQVGWTNNAISATSWDIYVVPAGSPAPTAGSTPTYSGVTTNPHLISGLNSQTAYDVYVRANCGAVDGLSEWSVKGTFTTTPNYCAGDHFYDTGGATSNYANNQNYTVTICPDSPGQVITVSFNAFGMESCCDDFYIFDGNSTAGTLLGNFTGTALPPDFTASTVSGCLTFQFTSDGSVTGIGWDATITCGTAPTCLRPSSVAFSLISSTTAQVSWVNNAASATAWDIYVVPTGSPAPTAGSTPTYTGVTTNPYTIIGLTSQTTYDVYVRANCGAVDGLSEWSIAGTFTTTPNYCSGDLFYDPGGTGNYANSLNVTTTICPDNPGDVVTVIFSQFALENNFDFLSIYDGNSTGAPLLGTFTANNMPPQFTSTATGGCLTFNFTSDGSVTAAGWVAQIICSPPPPCQQPNGLSVTNIGEDTATLSWNEQNPGVTSWQIVIQPAGTGYPNASSTIITVTSNPYVATGLNSSTSYEFYVLSDCGSVDGLSFWSGPMPFNTLFAGCGTSDPAGNACAEATPVCSLDGYCGNTSSTYTVNTWTQLSTAFCGSIENNSFLTFQATSTSITLSVNVGNCTDNSGIQFMVFTAANCGSGAVTSLGCFFQMNPGTNTLTFTGLTPGQNYYLMIDGFAGDVCDYTVAVTSGGSASTDVEITPETQTICIGTSIDLTATGGNGTYNWSPATGLDSTTGSTVTFTPTTTGVFDITVTSTDPNPLCSTTAIATITVVDEITPTFDAIPVLCQNSTAPTLPTTSNNGIVGTWNPATIDTSVFGSTTYTFTPNPGQCGVVYTVDIEVEEQITPSFITPSPICSGATAPVLSNTSNNGITGTWSPSTVSNTATDTYTFTPDAGQCATTTTVTVEVYTNCTFGAFASAAWLENCSTDTDGEFFNITGSGADIIGPIENVYPDNFFGVYVQNSGNLIFRGGEIKTFKTTSSNVCSARMNYRVYEATATPGAFTTLNLPIFDDCVAGTFPTGGPCQPGDQKWQEVLSDLESPIDLTLYPPGNYIIEVYFDVTGDNDSTSDCDDTIFVNNGGSNFIATFSIQAMPTFTSTNPTACNAADGTITVSDLNPSSTYTVTYSYNGTNNTPVNYTSNSSGEIVISGLDEGVYSVFTFSINDCLIEDTLTVITLVDPGTTPTFDAIEPICEGTIISLPTTSLEGITGSWTPSFNNTATTTYTFNPDANQCATTTTLEVVVYALPVVDEPANVTACDSYVLPALTVGNYYTGMGGTGTMLTAGTAITSTQTLYVYAQTGTTPNCTDEHTFTVTINNSPVVDEPANVTACDSYVLPVLTVGNYYTGMGGTGTMLTAGTAINSTQTLYVYAQTGTTPNCTDEHTFTVTINNSPVVDEPANVTACDSYVLPALTVGNYYTGMGGTGTMLTAGTAITSTQTLYVYAQTGTTPNCTDEHTFTVTINNSPVVDEPANVTACDSYVLPALTVGNYYTGMGGTGTMLTAGTAITSTQTLYVYAQTGTTPNCTDEHTFTVTINITPNAVAPSSVTVCDSYVLPALAVGNYYTGMGGTGTMLTAGTAINSTQTLYVYAQTGTTPNCTDEDSFVVTVNTSPNVVAPADITTCDSYVLPALTVGNYYTGMGGTGTMLNAGDVLTSSQTIYVFAQTNTLPNCTDEDSFEVTITPLEVPTFAAIEVCMGSNATSLPSISENNISGSWSPSVINTSAAGYFNYVFTPSSGECATPVTLSVRIKNCNIQNGISPNGDGLNDSFDLSDYNVDKLEIFNRYGMKMYDKNNYRNEWYGTTNDGDELPDGTYYYVIYFNDMEAKTGWIYINREY